MDPRAGDTRLSEPNITPLIDVLLVLLILFLLVTPAVRRRLDTELPAPAAGERGPTRAPVVRVATSGLTLDARPMPSLDQLEVALRERLAAAAERRVLVQADGALPYREVVRVLDAARGAGAERIAMLPRPER